MLIGMSRNTRENPLSYILVRADPTTTRMKIPTTSPDPQGNALGLAVVVDHLPEPEEDQQDRPVAVRDGPEIRADAEITQEEHDADGCPEQASREEMDAVCVRS